jgi:hypothetical protein
MLECLPPHTNRLAKLHQVPMLRKFNKFVSRLTTSPSPCDRTAETRPAWQPLVLHSIA